MSASRLSPLEGVQSTSTSFQLKTYKERGILSEAGTGYSGGACLMDYSRILSRTIQEVKPSGIRKFFDLAAEMENVISLGVGEPDFKTPCRCAARGSARWKREEPGTLPTPVLKS